MKIIIEFDDKTKREYYPTEKIIKALNKGEKIKIELIHPNYGEMCEITRRLA